MRSVEDRYERIPTDGEAANWFNNRFVSSRRWLKVEIALVGVALLALLSTRGFKATSTSASIGRATRLHSSQHILHSSSSIYAHRDRPAPRGPQRGLQIKSASIPTGTVDAERSRSVLSLADVKPSFVKLDPLPDEIHGRPLARSSHGLSIVNGGRRLVLYGGENIARTPFELLQALWVADLGDDGTWQWKCGVSEDFYPGLTMPPPRVAHAQAAVDDRFVYVFGGRAGIEMDEAAMNDLWVLDTSNLTWSEVQVSKDGSAPPEKRSFHRMVAVNRSLYVFGGCSAGHGRLADLHRFDIDTKKWHDLGSSSLLRGRGGANVLLLDNDALAVVGGFAGEETKDGHRYDLSKQTWDPALLENLEELRPRSVCIAGSFHSKGVCVLFGGEVDPSARGHEGAGDFANDVVLLDSKTAAYLGSISAASSDWPETRGWSDGATYDDGKGNSYLYLFGGLSGNDAAPERFKDLWRMDLKRS